MHSHEPRRDGEESEEKRPYRVRLPGFVLKEEMGLGEVIKRASYAVGIKACGGCGRRAAALNRWVTFGGASPK